MVGHCLSERFHRPARRVVGWRLGHQLHQQQHVIMVIYGRAAGTLQVIQPGQIERLVPFPSHRDLVVMEIHPSRDLTIRHTITRQQHDPRPLRDLRFDSPSTRPSFQDRSITTTQFQPRKTHARIKTHHRN